jgi:hypothetical protein
MKSVCLAIVVLSLTLSCVARGQAAQHAVQTPYGEKVVHTRLMPVLMHKAVPPFAGKHVYQGRVGPKTRNAELGTRN